MSYIKNSLHRTFRALPRLNQYLGRRHSSKVQSDSAEIPLKPHQVPIHGKLLILVPVSTFCCALYFEAKEEVLNEVAEKCAVNSLKPAIPVELADEDYRRVSITGKFDHSREVYIMNRPKKTGCESLSYLLNYTNGYDSILFKKRIGHWVITPFVLSSGKVILVNRGWVPPNLKDPASRKEAQIEGEVKLTGLLRKTNEALFFIPSRFWYHNPSKGEWGYRNIEEMSKVLNTEPIFVDLDRSAFLGLNAPIPNQTLVDFCFKWYEKYLVASIAVTLGILWYYKFIGPIKLQPHWW